jgi:hypothetical protein
MIARKDFTQQISKKAAIDGLWTNNYSNDAFPEVLRVTFLRAAAATPNYYLPDPQGHHQPEAPALKRALGGEESHHLP